MTLPGRSKTRQVGDNTVSVVDDRIAEKLKACMLKPKEEKQCQTCNRLSPSETRARYTSTIGGRGIAGMLVSRARNYSTEKIYLISAKKNNSPKSVEYKGHSRAISTACWVGEANPPSREVRGHPPPENLEI